MIRHILCQMRDARGLYGWPLWVQRLICWADDIPQSAVGQYASSQELSDAMWIRGDPAEMTPIGLKYRDEALARARQ